METRSKKNKNQLNIDLNRQFNEENHELNNQSKLIKKRKRNTNNENDDYNNNEIDESNLNKRRKNQNQDKQLNIPINNKLNSND